MRTLVLGLGNPVLRDDGVGWHVVSALEADLAGVGGLTVERCCRGGLFLMERMIGYERVVVVDALASGAPPGTVRRLGLGDLETAHSASGHDVGLATAIALGRQAGAALPPDDEIVFVGVEALDTQTFGEDLTSPVAAAVDEAAAAVWGALFEPGRIPT